MGGEPKEVLRPLNLVGSALLLLASLGCRATPEKTPAAVLDTEETTTAAPGVVAEQPPPGGPNLLVIMADQLRADYLGVAGHPLVRTPHLDRLAASGTRLTHAFAPSPSCVPSRHSLLTGMWPRNHGARQGGMPIRAGVRTIADELGERGYLTGVFGKMHFNEDEGWHGFDDVIVSMESAGGPRGDYKLWWEERELPWTKRDQLSEFGSVGVNPLRVEDFPTSWLTTRFLMWLENWSRDAERRPFCIWLSYFAPHHPAAPPEPYASLYDPTEMPPIQGPAVPTGRGQHLGQSRRQQEWYAKQGYARMERGEADLYRARYGGLVTLLDSQVGRVLGALKRLDLERETLVVFVSDHGDFAGEHQVVTKGPFLLDSLLRVPLIFRLPGTVESGQELPELVSLVDLMPTLCDLMGLAPPTEVDGRSFAALLRGAELDWANATYGEYGSNRKNSTQTFMVRTHDWKLIDNGVFKRTPQRAELYDLVADPGELVNLAGEPAYAGIEAQLRERLVRWLAETDGSP
jgi:arylsulfatase A-like enzyme